MFYKRTHERDHRLYNTSNHHIGWGLITTKLILSFADICTFILLLYVCKYDTNWYGLCVFYYLTLLSCNWILLCFIHYHFIHHPPFDYTVWRNNNSHFVRDMFNKYSSITKCYSALLQSITFNNQKPTCNVEWVIPVDGDMRFCKQLCDWTTISWPGNTRLRITTSLTWHLKQWVYVYLYTSGWARYYRNS